MLICKILTKEAADFAHCREIRRRVFVEEQHVPQPREQDDLDYYSVHYLFTTPDDQAPFGTARSRIEDNYSKIERFAFLPEYRGKGLAKKAFRKIVEDCFDRFPHTPIIVNTQAYLEDFYASMGFVPEGDIFIDAGIKHRRMRLDAAR